MNGIKRHVQENENKKKLKYVLASNCNLTNDRIILFVCKRWRGNAFLILLTSKKTLFSNEQSLFSYTSLVTCMILSILLFIWNHNNHSDISIFFCHYILFIRQKKKRTIYYILLTLNGMWFGTTKHRKLKNVHEYIISLV